jgi:putative transferase (TIGR04331 family)
LNKKYFKNQKLDNFLILLRSSGYNTTPYDRYSEGLNQLDLTVKLCKKFSTELTKKTIIRAHYGSKNRIEDYIKDLDGFKIDYSEQNYFDAINRAKLMLFNHDSTGILEMFAINKPTLCLWAKGNDHLNNFVIEDYELLKKAKILFEDPEDLYKHLLEIWNDPLRWWYSDNVQKNLFKFVNLYSQVPDNNFKSNFKKLIKERI